MTRINEYQKQNQKKTENALDKITNKYTCKKCGSKAMRLNIIGKKIYGYCCVNCKEINYPIKEELGLI